jgi:hypothetical protein
MLTADADMVALLDVGERQRIEDGQATADYLSSVRYVTLDRSPRQLIGPDLTDTPEKKPQPAPRFSCRAKPERSSANYSGLIVAACLPFGPILTSKLTFWPSCKDLNPLD